jgi:hypothetical protein
MCEIKLYMYWFAQPKRAFGGRKVDVNTRWVTLDHLQYHSERSEGYQPLSRDASIHSVWQSWCVVWTKWRIWLDCCDPSLRSRMTKDFGSNRTLENTPRVEILRFAQDDTKSALVHTMKYIIMFTPVAGNFECQRSRLVHLWRMHPSNDREQ